MAICKNCGNEINDNAKFCNNCGKPNENISTETNATNVAGTNGYNYTSNQMPNVYSNIPYIPPERMNEPTKTNAFAITGFVMSLCSLVICCLGFLSIPSLIFSIISYVQISKSNQKGKGFAIAGIVVSVSTIVIWIIILILAKLDIIHFYTYQTYYPNNYNSY